MKLRIKGNSVRLRLTTGDVNRLLAEGVVRETVCFGPNKFGYELVSAAGSNTVSADLVGSTIVISAPARMIREWAEDDRLSIEQRGFPNVLIEKDLACTKRSSEHDTFPAPQQDC